MPQARSRFGLSCAISTPFDRGGDVDTGRLVAHAMESLARGCDSITLFGTTGEGASIGLHARGRVFDAMLAASIAPKQILTAVVASSIEDAQDQARLALDRGFAGLLLAPPFYFRGVTDDGLYAWFGQLFDRLGAGARDMFVYHIPSVTGVPLSVDLIGRLKRTFPGIVVGVKDSSGTWSNTKALLKAHSDLMILVGDERDLAKAVRMGGSGSICGVANILPELLAGAAKFGKDDTRIKPIVEAILSRPVLAAIKMLIAYYRNDPEWKRMRAPLSGLDGADATRLIAEIETALRAKSNEVIDA
jgi:4-hydroxy-tetrahydrodipicolinate synthase